MIKDLPDSNGAVVVLSGGLDSTIAMRYAVEKYGAKNVHAISFDYGQKQRIELTRASMSTAILGVSHRILKIDSLRELSMGVSANVDPTIAVPSIKEVLGDPAPITEVPYRNAILLFHALAYAQGKKLSVVIIGIQTHDLYGYFDATQAFVDGVNAIAAMNRKYNHVIEAPFAQASKKEELELLRSLDGDLRLAASTLSCYDPTPEGLSCGRCATCAERLKAFIEIGETDPVPYV